MRDKATFFAIGVGPGPAGYLPIAAYNALKQADVIIAPRAARAGASAARRCIADLDLPDYKFREIVFSMDSDRDEALNIYEKLSAEIEKDLSEGRSVAYLTIGDTLTYSTFSYLLAALQKRMPEAACKIIPGITSYAALAAAVNWPIGQGKERVLILPCPDSRELIIKSIKGNDVVVVMKIGDRLPLLISVIKQLGLERNCAVAQKIGSEEEIVSTDLDEFVAKGGGGYMTTMLIRCSGETIA